MEAFSGILNALGGASGLTKGLGAITSLAGAYNQFSLAQKEKAAMDRAPHTSKRAGARPPFPMRSRSWSRDRYSTIA